MFGLAENDTVPFPVPVAPDITDTQPTLLTAFQAQPDGVNTFTLPGPPVDRNEAEVADNE
jgi:hypothetical protein